MKWLFILLSLLLIMACTSSPKTDTTAPYDAWFHRSEWKANSFGYNWEAHSVNAFTKKMPIFYETTAGDKDFHVAIEMADLDSTIGIFDSLQITYSSTLDLNVTIALLPEDTHGFELRKNRKNQIPATKKKKKKITLTPKDFGDDWEKKSPIKISQCNNIAIGNRNYLTPEQKVFIQIHDIRIYHPE